MSWRFVAEAFMLTAALSADAFAASFAYGASRIRIPLSSLLVVDGICTGLLGVSLLMGSWLRPWISPAAARTAGVLLLALLGGFRLFDSGIKALIRRRVSRRRGINREWRFSLLSLRVVLTIYADPEAADRDGSKSLSPGEAASLAVAMSLDGLAVGFGAGLASTPVWLVLVFSLLLSAGAMKGGCALGRRAAAKLKTDVSWLSGALLLVLAGLKW